MFEILRDEPAPSPLTRPLIRSRVGTGIGQRGRFIASPSERASQLTAAQLQKLPEFLAPPRPGFPLVVQVRATGASGAGAEPSRDARDDEDAVLRRFGREARPIIDTRLPESEGALLFRGLPIRSASDFASFLTGTGLPPVHSHGASEREAKAAAVFGASDDVPPEFTLHPHNEQAYLSRTGSPTYPRKVFFCCLHPCKVGGETPITSNREVTRRLGAAALDKFRDGVEYVQTLPSGDPHAPMQQNLGGEQTWQKALGVTTKADAEREAANRGYSFSWIEPDSQTSALRIASKRDALIVSTSTVQAGPSSGNPPRGPTSTAATTTAAAAATTTTEKIWFNQASNVFSFVPHYANGGGPIDDDMLEHINAVLWQSTVAFRWSEGDVLCLDNERCMHGRTSFQGAREIVVGFSKL